jgi:hypothetical protein
MIVALAAWLSARRLEAGDRLRLIARVPAYWALLLVLGIAILIAYGAWIGTARRRRRRPVSDSGRHRAVAMIFGGDLAEWGVRGWTATQAGLVVAASFRT